MEHLSELIWFVENSEPCYNGRGARDQSEAAYQQIMATKTHRTIDYHRRASDLIALGKYEAAAREARRALQRNPDDAQAHRLLAWARWAQGELSRAEFAARAALRLAPDDADVHSTLALILTDRGKRQEARAHHERAITLAPAVPAFHTRYARFLLRTRRWAASLREANAALKLDPRHVNAFLIRADVLRAQGHLSAAETAVHEALALEPNSAAAHQALGRIHLARDEGDEALACFREALRLDPTDEVLKRELIRSVEARLPVIGVMWRYGQVSMSHRVFWTAINLFSFVWCCLTGWSNPGLTLLFSVFYLFDLIWGFFVWVVDPLVTHAVMKGWIK